MELNAFPPVLLTSCVYVADQTAVNLNDPEDRITHTLESIDRWLHIAPGIRLVICDSSGYDFSQKTSQLFPDADIEFIAFEADRALVKLHGKGYGEGEIVNYALQHSIYLKRSDSFAKCTAKLWVVNFQECVQEWNGKFLCKVTFSNVFSFKKTYFNHVDTRFYLVKKDFYLKYFSKAHLDLGGSSGLGIEDTFRKIVLENNMEKIIFDSPPVIGGVGGGTGKYYNTKWSKRIKEILRSKLVKVNPAFRQLFNSK